MNKIYLHFDTETAEGNRHARELQEFLKSNYDFDFTREKEQDNTQDAGAILAVILGASSVVEIAKGIALWLQKKQGLSVTITEDKGRTEVVATGLSGKDLENTFKGYLAIKKADGKKEE
jgi:hypothetical protein